MAERTRSIAVIAGLLLGLALSSGSASAAPPVEPPGKSGEAPGQTKEPGRAVESTPPGQAKKEDEPTEPQSAPAEPAITQAPEPASESPRFTNASGKPKHNVPAAAEAAPESSVSAPGNSGRHKLTICHKGHAITLDVHAAKAHIDGHGDTYAVAGAKGRAACPQSSGLTPPKDTPSGPGPVRPDVTAAVAATGRSTSNPADPADPADPAVDPAGGNGVSETSHEQNGAVLAGAAGAADGGTLPFTGASLGLLVLFGLGLVGTGVFVRRASLGWSPRRSSSR